MTDTTTSITASARRFFSGTFLSRCSGLARDMSMAYAFGGHPIIAAFFVAFRFSHLCRRLFGEGAMQAAFVPHFESCRKEGREHAFTFFRDLVASLSLFLVVLIGVAGAALWGWAYLGSEKVQLILNLTTVLLPGLLFICLYGINSAVLNCEKIYFTPSVAPVAFNMAWVGMALALKDQPMEKAVWVLSAAVVLACVLQWGITVPKVVALLRGAIPKTWWRPRLFSREVRSLIRPLCLGIAGVSATQINSALDSVFALQAHPSGPAYLWYAIRLQQLPLALFGVAMAGALLPPLSRCVEEGKMGQYREFLFFALKRSAVLMIPCTVFIMVAGPFIVSLLYGRGDFGASAAHQTVWCLRAYSLGLLPMVWVILLAPGFYALKDFAVPMKMTAVAVVVNASLNAILVLGLKWGPASVALATSVAAAVHAAGLLFLLERKMAGSLQNPFFLVR